MEGGFACDSVKQPFAKRESPRRRFLTWLWDMTTGHRPERGAPWYNAKGLLPRAAVAASVTCYQVWTRHPRRLPSLGR